MSQSATRPEGLSAYIAVTAAYWAFMLTDGALRMLVLLHFHRLGFSPVQLAYLFVLYEIAGVVTNLCAGWIAARFGLASTLYAGLGLQIVALLALAQLDPTWAVGASVVFVMLVQGASGVAKDLAKMSSKSAVKLLAPAEDGGLFRWVALLTGSKNMVKGLGFLLGAALLATLGFVWAVLGMAAILALILIAVLTAMPPGLPKGRKGAKFSEVFSKSANVNWLSAARVFLFGARDVWFVVGIPIYFYAVLSDGTEESNRAAFFMIGTFMAVWVILYGLVQIYAPRLLRAKSRPAEDLISAAKGWAWSLAAVPAALTLAALFSDGPQGWLTVTLVIGLLAFGAVFAINSSLHSYLILSFTKAERVTMDVGFYYMANAAGRLLGTLMSGLSYQIGGLPLMLGAAAIMVALSALLVGFLKPDQS
ncbi:organoarsenical effux MFS transporter ArsJ [Sulfitobacter sp. KE34]|uniref:Organoarsenical effux MFS transporter ArsJ n=1 Tax=Sulfitobacter faviae TaxID=1775881 RepID=A0AAX3LQZ4_9RHOB|nr:MULTISPECIES: organoarsenical effux MFS transporter ArsJ [Sulfitobacter]MDF3351684.1 organoarsenical effux MFS transporter ArsJ [Sulfitobacter sp. KE12]MDF3355356.1 organoarsenical effux MFS transporter ArsJ [Sulfitobacter sp. KE27]MDF3359004.1 organoarsenical effux MFS transporter ArsJ [Sulfitobacter sp. KE33]MDF3361363.1 organoarsenical effux MFS transporter ArsJ [Sulfitobacter sp. Ks41]MDF3366428.1 organoarsenical effux MFS transporter ArsJ [Sulfitobacter sp. Ks34]